MLKAAQRLALSRIQTRTLTSRATKQTRKSVNKQATNALPEDPSDIFGSLSESGSRSLRVLSAENRLQNDSDGYDVEQFDIEPRKNAYYYKYEIRKYARQGSTGLRKALELFNELKSKARLTPIDDNFAQLFYGCAKAGYTKKAFELYTESCKYLSSPMRSTITCLINACAECPFPEYGLERLRWFLKHVKVEYNKTLNEAQYNAAIKAFGKLGQLEEASNLVQEMLDNEVRPTITTFNMLLIGCASNKESGCTIALRVYKRLKMFDYKPDLITYRILLRCIRDCGIGSHDMIKNTLGELPALTSLDRRIEYNKRERAVRKIDKMRNHFTWLPLVEDIGRSIAEAIDTKIEQKSLQTMKEHDKSLVLSSSKVSPDQFNLMPYNNNISEQLPNLLSDDHLNLTYRIKGIHFDRLKSSSDRLMLFGGFRGYLETMMKDGCKPDTKTFSLILECLAPTKDNMLEYFKFAQKYNIQRDLLFYDLLIEHVSKIQSRFRIDLALYFVEQMHIDNLRPNISTFESIAGACQSWSDALRLIQDLEKCGFTVSGKTIRRFFDSATKSLNFPYLIELIEYSKEIDFRPPKKLVERLEAIQLEIGNKILDQERNRCEGNFKLTENQVRDFDVFRKTLVDWLKRVDLYEEDHPWAQFHVDSTSKRQGFVDYVKSFKVMEELKKEAIEQGRNLGNVPYKAYKRTQSQLS